MGCRLFTWDNFDPADTKIAKRSLLTFSIGTLLLANITIVSDDFSVLGLVVEVSQPRLIALGQVLSSVFLVLFVVKELPNVFLAFQLRAIMRLKREQELQRSKLAESWGMNSGKEYEASPDGEFNELTDTHEWEHSRVEKRFRDFIAGANRLAGLITDYLIPLSAGILAILYPFALDQLTSHLVSK